MFFNNKKSTVKSLAMAAAKSELEKDKTIHLIDVRTRQEYHEGHIPGSVNIPLGNMQRVAAVTPEKGGKIFVYCLSGGRSAQAAGQLAAMGYTDVTNIGGIVKWPGQLERTKN